MVATSNPPSSQTGPLIALVAGEVSGDLLGAGVIRELKVHYPNAKFMGIGGPKMIAEGMESYFPMERLAVMGIVEVLGRIFELLRIRKELTERLIAAKPDLFLGIDAPDFNLSLEQKLKAAGISTAHYVSPSVWAWRQGRIKKIKKAIDLMLTFLPFEADFYRQHQVPVEFVGHPLADMIDLEVDKKSFREQFSLSNEDEVLAVLPGSRGGEVKQIGPVFVDLIKQLRQQKSDLKFIVPMVNENRKKQFTDLLDVSPEALNITIVDGNSRGAMAAADAVLLASGTATLEAMLLKKPMVVGYKWGSISHVIIASQVKVEHVALPNLLAGKAVVPEFIQKDCTAEKMLPAVLKALDADQTVTLKEQFLGDHKRLRQNADVKAANALKELINE